MLKQLRRYDEKTVFNLTRNQIMSTNFTEGIAIEFNTGDKMIPVLASAQYYSCENQEDAQELINNYSQIKDVVHKSWEDLSALSDYVYDYWPKHFRVITVWELP